MTTRIHENLLKGMFILILFCLLILQSLVAQAQSARYTSPKPYKGFVVNFGTRSSSVNSGITKINHSDLVQAGGQVGLVLGNRIVRSRIGVLGYYSSSESFAGTADLYTSNIAVNLYPLAAISGSDFMIEPYITCSVDYDQFKFFGHYSNHEPGEVNYSVAEAPYLGKIKQINATIGAGIEVKLKDDYDFIHLFSEVRYGTNVSTKTTNAIFSGTELKNQTQVIVGLSFGMHH